MSENEKQINVSWASMASFISNTINDWALEQGGICIMAEQGTEELLTGYNNAVGPKCMVYCIGETAYGSEDVRELTGRVIRNFDVKVSRGKMLTGMRNLALTSTVGPSKPFLDLVEDARDIVRELIFPTPMCTDPVIYYGTNPSEVKDGLIDSYIISFGIITEIGRPQTISSQLGGGEFVDLVDPLQIITNQSPGTD